MLLALIFGIASVGIGLNTLAMDRSDPKEAEALKGGRALTLLLVLLSIGFAIAATVQGHGNF